MYTITPPEDEVEFDYLEQILLSEDYETQEEIDHRLSDEYKQFQIYELSDEQMLEFARAGTGVNECSLLNFGKMKTRLVMPYTGSTSHLTRITVK